MTPLTSSASAPPLQMAPEPMDVDVDADSSEYETDTDAEPEEFYLSLDLTIPTPIHAGPSSNPHVNSAPPSHLPPRPLSSTTRSGRSGRRSLPKHSSAPAPPPPPRRASSSSPSSADDDEQQQQQTNPVERWAAGDHARIQILDLHTPNPLVSFGNRIWSGSWTATVGTEIFVRCPKGPAPEDDPALPHAYVSQKDTSAAAAAGAQVEEEEADPDPEADPAAGEVVATAGVRVHCLPAVLAVRQRGLAAAYASERTYGWRPTGKSSFLERLEEIRVAKGEKRPAGAGEEGSTEEGTAGVESETDGERAVLPPPVAMGSAFQNRVDGALVEAGAGAEAEGGRWEGGGRAG